MRDSFGAQSKEEYGSGRAWRFPGSCGATEWRYGTDQTWRIVVIGSCEDSGLQHRVLRGQIVVYSARKWLSEALVVANKPRSSLLVERRLSFLVSARGRGIATNLVHKSSQRGYGLKGVKEDGWPE